MSRISAFACALIAVIMTGEVGRAQSQNPVLPRLNAL